MNTLIQLEMLAALRRLKRGSDSSDDSGGETSTQDRAFKGIFKARRRYEKHPERVVEEFVTRMKRELGAVYRRRGRKNATSHRLLDPDEAAGTSELVACCDERMAEASSPEVEHSGLRAPISSS